MNKLVNRDKAILEYLFYKYGKDTLKNLSNQFKKEKLKSNNKIHE